MSVDKSYDLSFQRRHIGPSLKEQEQMLSELNLKSLEELVEKALPETIRTGRGMDLPQPLSESAVLQRAKQLAQKNKLYKNFIGQGYYGTHTPSVIERKIFTNPSWYTAYTPYQSEIAQGRLEALLNFQTMVTDLTAMDIAGASLLDEGTAVAEGVAMALQHSRNSRKVLVDEGVLEASLAVLKTRAEPLGWEIVTGDLSQLSKEHTDYGAVVIQYPDRRGRVQDWTALIEKAKEQGGHAVVAADLLALTLLKAPGEMGADVVVGSTQRFGVPMGFGGPHAGYLSTRDAFKRTIPGRIVGVSVDARGKVAYRLAMQTREQHIRRERATSNICTSQVLLAVMSSMYAVYHGPEGLKNIAESVRAKCLRLKGALQKAGYTVDPGPSFDTLALDLKTEEALQELRQKALADEINFFYRGTELFLSVDETTTEEELQAAAAVLGADLSAPPLKESFGALERTSEYLQHPVFLQHRSETAFLRYIHNLESKDLSLVHSMIPLGSCTMKLNAATEMAPLTEAGFSGLHPFVPLDQAQGSLELIRELESLLERITGFSAFSLQPNAGSQGEFAGLLAIRQYHLSQNQSHRNICLIPSSAHGTNPASAVMAGMKVVVVQCDDEGNIDVDNLKAKADEHKENLAAFMVTYPSTHGVFEESIRQMCKIVHDNGGLVYMDGANLNALVGLAQPGEFGPDVAHLNLHKTFCIPHGGGGPGVGPIGVVERLKPFLPSHPIHPECSPGTAQGPVSSAPWGSALILPISWAYILMMGDEGLTRATQVAILSANYIAHRLKDHYDVVYRGQNGFVAHECIIDTRPFKEHGVQVDDLAKRLMDYGFHAPTMSWPVAGTLMIEPTESESKEEIDRFCDSLIQIREEIKSVAAGTWPKDNNPLVKAPHTLEDVLEWDRPYTAQTAVRPLEGSTVKFWPAVNRIDNAYGDRNLVCTCPPLSDYE